MFKALAAANLTLEVSTKPLSDEELLSIAQRMVDAPTKDEQDALQQAFIDGFYGKHVSKPA
jgi:hypothetical protein